MKGGTFHKNRLQLIMSVRRGPRSIRRRSRSAARAARDAIGRWALNGAAGLALGFILLPLLLVTWLAFFRQEIPSFPPEGYSLQWFGAVLDQQELRRRLPPERSRSASRRP